MERTCPPPSNSNPSAGGAAKFLANLPNRGFLSSTTIPSANPGGMRVYICDHDTSPPEDQLIKTNQMNILIRSLVLNKQKGEASSKAKGIVINEGSRKRTAEKSLDGRASSKKPATSSTPNSSRHEGSKSCGSDKDFQSMKVEELRSLLREQGLPPKGRKDELIARLRSVDC